MTTYDDLAQRYIDTWNETDPDARRTAVDALFAPDARYIDPMADVQGASAVADTIAAVQGQFPGYDFRLAGPADGHHEQVRFSWELGPADQTAPIVGFDVAIIDPSGQIRAVYGFLDRVPTAS